MAGMQKLPAKRRLEQIYEAYCPQFELILDRIEQKLKHSIRLSSSPNYKARIKSFKSYYQKVLRKRADCAAEASSLVTLTDMIGIRVICAFLEDLDIVEQQIQAAFDVKEIERKGAEQTFKEFGYESVHVLVAIPPDCIPEQALPLPDDTVCEIQIRTILQDAWAEVEHELIYKAEFSPFDKPLRRKLASINASLSLADIIFQEIRDYQKKLQTELEFRRDTFYEKADEITDELLGVHGDEEDTHAVSIVSPYTKGSIDDLVLEALHEHNLNHFDKAVSIYTQILRSGGKNLPPVVASVILKHRGMAYFAENKYDEALSDFKESVNCDPTSFRSLYYEGIVYSVQGMEAEAVRCYDASVAINGFHSHVYYRRAISYFNMGEYQKALQDLDAAASLGLNNTDCQALRTKLMDKFDMSM